MRALPRRATLTADWPTKGSDGLENAMSKLVRRPAKKPADECGTSRSLDACTDRREPASLGLELGS